MSSYVVSTASFGLSVRNDKRLGRQEMQQVAQKVYLGEAPSYAYAKHKPERSDGTWWAVANTSGADIYEVWVEGKKGENDATLNIWTVQRCHMYALPPDLEPIAIHFKDSRGRWRRAVSAPPVGDHERIPANNSPDIDSSWDMDIEQCGVG